MEQTLPRTLPRQRQTHCEVGAQSRGSGHTPDSRAAEEGVPHSSTGTWWSSAPDSGRPLCYQESYQEAARLPANSAAPCLSRACSLCSALLRLPLVSRSLQLIQLRVFWTTA